MFPRATVSFSDPVRAGAVAAVARSSPSAVLTIVKRTTPLGSSLVPSCLAVFASQKHLYFNPTNLKSTKSTATSFHGFMWNVIWMHAQASLGAHSL